MGDTSQMKSYKQPIITKFCINSFLNLIIYLHFQAVFLFKPEKLNVIYLMVKIRPALQFNIIDLKLDEGFFLVDLPCFT